MTHAVGCEHAGREAQRFAALLTSDDSDSDSDSLGLAGCTHWMRREPPPVVTVKIGCTEKGGGKVASS